MRAQTAMELAVFGGILIFVVSVIVRQAMGAGYAQNQYLRAMRQAMSTSFRYSEGLLGTGDDASHNTTSILFIEDRLTADSAKYGAIDRTPYIVSGSATHSRNLFLPVDAGENKNLPVFDMFINGKHFPFQLARFKTVNLAQRCKNVGPPCPAECKGDCSANSVQFFPGDNLCRDSCNPVFCNAGAGECAATSAKTWPMPWVANCVQYTGLCQETCLTSGCTTCCDPGAGDCLVGSGVTFEATIGCAQLYGIMYNHDGFVEWCDGIGIPCPSCPGPGCNFSADERFDLDRDGVLGALDDPDEPDGAQRETFAWQWYSALGVDETEEYPLYLVGGGGSTSLIGRGEGIVIESMDCERDCATEQRNTSVDMDGDLKREHIMADTKVVDAATGVITRFTNVMDSQDGDLDFTRGDSDAGPDAGLTRNTWMYVRVRDGTYLLIKEGNLYGDGLQYIRTTQKKDQIDLIERRIQLSNDTDRFCDRNGDVTALGSPDWAAAGWNASIPNPVEACNGCSTSGNINLTCMDEDPAGDGTQPPIIFVRSRVVDRHGRKWITETTSDPYVEFVAPGGP